MSGTRIRLARREMMQVAAALGGVAALQGMASVFGMAVRPAHAQALGTVSTLRSTSKSWLWGAEDFGVAKRYFDSGGLRVTQASTERGVNHDALLAGAADIVLGAPIQNIRVQMRNQPVVMFCAMVNKYASNIVIKKEIADRLGVNENSSTADKGRAMRGLRLGTTGPGAGPDQLMRWFMRRGGLNPDRDAQLTPVRGGPAMVAAMQRNQLDGFCLSSPTSDVAVQRAGATYLVNMATNPPPELSDFVYIAASASRKTMEEKGPQLTAYCRGTALALKQIHENPNDFKTWARAWFSDMEESLFEVSFRNNVPIYMRSPIMTEAQYKTQADFLNEDQQAMGQPTIPASYGFKDAFELRFVEAALRQLG